MSKQINSAIAEGNEGDLLHLSRFGSVAAVIAQTYLSVDRSVLRRYANTEAKAFLINAYADDDPPN